MQQGKKAYQVLEVQLPRGGQARLSEDPPEREGAGPRALMEDLQHKETFFSSYSEDNL
jgi:hypothetical protein